MDANGVDVDFCSSCSGIWLDRREWTAVFGETPDQVAAEKPSGGDPLRCPHCIDEEGQRRPLTPCRFPGGPPVQVDACRSCSGVWLDAGEMPAIKRYYAGTSSPSSHFDDVEAAWEQQQACPPPLPITQTSRTRSSGQRGASILIALGGAVFLALSWSQISIGLSSPSWPTVDGEITRRWSESRRETRTQDGRRRSRTTHYEYVEFSYEVDGATLQAKRYNADRRVRSIPGHLSEGQAVNVSYDPDHPQRAVIATGLTFSTLASFLVSLAAMLIGGLGFLGVIDPTLGGRLTSVGRLASRWRWISRWR